MEITKAIAIGILSSRIMAANAGQIDNVRVTNVSFTDKDGKPHQSDDWDEGKPYAIVNTNLINSYGKTKAQELFIAGEYEEATNQSLSARVPVETGRTLANSYFANVVVEPRTFVPADEDEEVTAISIKKIMAVAGVDASELKAEWDFGSEDDLEGAPKMHANEAGTN